MEMQTIVTRLHSASFLNQKDTSLNFWAICSKGKCLNPEGESGQLKVMRNAKNKESVLRILEGIARTLFLKIYYLLGQMTSWESVTPTGY